MKAKKGLNIFLGVALAVFLILAVTPAALAEEVEVNTGTALNTAITTAENGATVNIRLTANITDALALDVRNGKNVTIDLNGHSLATGRVFVDGSSTVSFSGGVVTVNGSLTAYGSTVGFSGGELNVKGPVSAREGSDIAVSSVVSDSEGVSADGGSTVVVDNDVTADFGSGLYVGGDGNEVTIGGDINASSVYTCYGIKAGDNYITANSSLITVTGDINVSGPFSSCGVFVAGSSNQIQAAGSVTVNENSGTTVTDLYGARIVSGSDNSVAVGGVTVKGNRSFGVQACAGGADNEIAVEDSIEVIGTGNEGAYAENGGNVQVEHDVAAMAPDASYTNTANYGAHAKGGGMVTVKGDVSASQYGAYAESDGTVDVTGDVSVTSNDQNGAYGVFISGGGTITVHKDVSITGTRGVYGVNAFNYGSAYAAEVTVDGSVTAETTGRDASSGYAYGIRANNCSITVQGNVSARSASTASSTYIYGVNAESGTVAVGGNVSVISDLTSATGVLAQLYSTSGSTVTVNGAIGTGTPDNVAAPAYFQYIYNGNTVNVKARTLTVAAGAGGTAGIGTASGASSGAYEAGYTVNLAAAPQARYRFNNWTSSDGGTFGSVSSASTTFTVPTANATVTASFLALPLYYVIIPDMAGGSVSASMGEAVKDEKVTLTVTANTGCRFVNGSLKYSYEDSEGATREVPLTVTDGEASFTMPESDVTVSAEFIQVFEVDDASSLSTALAGFQDGDVFKLTDSFTYTGNIAISEKTALFELNGETLTVEGKVSVDNGGILDCDDDNGALNVKGVVDASGSGSSITVNDVTFDGASANLGGVRASEGGEVEVKGSVSVNGSDFATGIKAELGTITVVGNVSVNGSTDVAGVDAVNGSTVTVHGDISVICGSEDDYESRGVCSSNSTVTVDGNVSVKSGGNKAGTGVYASNDNEFASPPCTVTVGKAIASKKYIYMNDVNVGSAVERDLGAGTLDTGYFEYSYGINTVRVKAWTLTVATQTSPGTNGGTAGINSASGDSSGAYEAGETVNLAAAPQARYRFNNWTSSAGGSFGDASSVSTTFTMPAANATVTASFSKLTEYAVTIQSMTGGSVTASTANALKGETVTLTVTADEGCRFVEGSLKYGYGSSTQTLAVTDGQASFEMPESAVTVSAEFIHVFEVNDAPSLSGALGSFHDGDVIRLTDDITFQSPVNINGKTVTFDLNDHTLDIETTGSSTALTVENGGEVLLAGSGALNVEGDFTAVSIYNGAATVTNARVSGYNSYGVHAIYGTVTVNGDVTAEGYSSYGVCADGTSVITVEGNVTAEGDYSYGVYADNTSTVTVKSDVTAEGDGSYGVYADNTSTVTVKSNVTAEGYNYSNGVGAYDMSTVTVEGYVTAEGDNSCGVDNYDSTVTVKKGIAASSQYILIYGISDNGNYSIGEGTLNEADGYFEYTKAFTSSLVRVKAWTLNVEAQPGTGGTAGIVGDSDASGKYESGAPVALTAAPSDGYSFISWTASGGSFDDKHSPSATFVMPASNLTVSAEFVQIIDVDTASGLSTLLSGPGSGNFIRLTDDITLRDPVVIDGKDVVFDLNGHTLDIEATGGDTALTVGNGGSVRLTGPGALNVLSEYIAVSVSGGDATVTNVRVVGDGSLAVFAENGGTVMVEGSVTAEGNMASGSPACGIFSDDGTVVVKGDVTTTGNSSVGVYLPEAGDVTVEGNVTADGTGSAGVYLEGEGTVTVNKAVTGDTYIYVFIAPGAPEAMNIGEGILEWTGYFRYQNYLGGAVLVKAWTLNVEARPGTGGTAGIGVYFAPFGTYEAGAAIALTASPQLGYAFKNWTSSSGGSFGNASSAFTAFTMPAADVTVTAEFEETYTVSIGSITGGTITASPTTATSGTAIDLTIAPDEGKRLKEGSLKYSYGSEDHVVSGDSFIMPAENVTVTAQFTDITYTISIGAITGGAITASPATAPAGAAIDLTITPDEGKRLKTGSLKYSYGSEDYVISGDSFTMPAADVTVTAQFEPVPPEAYTVSIGVITGGVITASPATATSGEAIQLTITPDEGKRLKAGSLKYSDGSEDHVISGASFIMPAADVTVTAEFEDIPYTVSIGSVTGGTITASPTTATAGETIHLAVTPEEGKRLKEGSLKYRYGSEDHAISGTSFVMPAANVTVTAEFEDVPQETYTVSIGSVTGGTITASPTTATSGTAIQLTITPDEGKRLKAGSLKYNNGTEDHIISGTSFFMPNANVMVTAEFEDIPPEAYTVSIGAITGGTITASPTAATTGEAIYLTIMPDAGKRLKARSLKYNDGTEDHIISGTSFIMPAANVTVTAEFEDILLSYTVTFDKNGGDTEANPKTVTVASGGNVGSLPTAPARSGYTFNGWNTAANGSGTAFTATTIVTANITVYAQWTASNPQGNNGGGTSAPPAAPPAQGQQTQITTEGDTVTVTTTVTATVGSDGTATATITPEQINDAISRAVAQSLSQGGGTAVQVGVVVQAPATASRVDVVLPQGALGHALQSGVQGLTVATQMASITFDGNTLSTLVGTGTEMTNVSIIRADSGSLTEGAQQLIGDRPVYDFSVAVGGSHVSELGGNAEGFIPYAPGEDEDTGSLVVLHTSQSGDTQIIEGGYIRPQGSANGSPGAGSAGAGPSSLVMHGGPTPIVPDHPDAPVIVPGSAAAQRPNSSAIRAAGGPNAGTQGSVMGGAGGMSFVTGSFSRFAVAYNKVTFKDVAESAWYNRAVGYIAAREITAGTGDGKFSPDARLTRGQFLVMLMKAYGIAPDAGAEDNFADAGSTYYTGYLAAAKKLGISGGVGNNMFAPDKEITRQEMFTLLYNALKTAGKLPRGNFGKPLSSFSDSGSIASWAEDAMTLMAQTGTVSGIGGKLSPTAMTTRAEMAQVLYSLLSR